MTKEYINSLPLFSFGGTIHEIDNPNQLSSAIDLLSKEKIVGFDTETKPTFKKGEYNPTALIQLATLSDAFLFRLNKIGYPDELFNWLGNNDIQKIGISIRDDIKDLKKLKPFQSHSFIELNELAQKNGVDHCGVRRLAAYYLGKRISKSQQVSNWENEPLTNAQKAYAATDAWICLKIYNAIKNKGEV